MRQGVEVKTNIKNFGGPTSFGNKLPDQIVAQKCGINTLIDLQRQFSALPAPTQVRG